MFKLPAASPHLKKRTGPSSSVVVPGLVWGNYPERAEPDHREQGIASWFERIERRSSGLARIEALARESASLARRYENLPAKQPVRHPDTLAILRARLMRDGLTPENCCKALAWIAARIHLLLNIELHENQYVCALHLLNQSLAEMATGEGKTLAAACAAAVMSMAGAPVHVLTANDYLAQRDAEQLAPLFADLGLTASSALESHSPDQRREKYRADVVYATAKTIAFDYLRDRLVRGQRNHSRHTDEHALQAASITDSKLLLRGLCCAIIDEADCILLDEAKTPLIIADAQSDPQERGRLWQALDLARSLKPGVDFRVNKAEHRVSITQAGVESLDVAAPAYGGAWQNRLHRQEMVRQALTALHLLTRDIHYIVQDDEIVIVDPTTGRIAEGRQWSMGLHALVALKERLPMPLGSRTLASLTYPRLFRRYHHLSGLSGTLHEDASELQQVYGLAVNEVARHLKLQRRQLPLRCFQDRDQQFSAACLRAQAIAATGRPVLIATDSVEESHQLAQRFESAGHAVAVLNASQTRDEAQIIAAAGQPAQVTIATQVAGRGTDIVLAEGVSERGGLHVLNLQMNRSARIDRQILGRCARQGDAGSSEHWIRLRQSPLDNDQAPGLLRPVFYGLAPLTSAGSLLSRLGTFLMLHSYQIYCRAEDANNRKMVLKNDQNWAKRLHFASVVE